MFIALLWSNESDLQWIEYHDNMNLISSIKELIHPLHALNRDKTSPFFYI